MRLAITVRNMQPDDEAFVGSCSHVGETEEWTASCRRRIPWLREQQRYGLRVKVALIDGEHIGFLYVMPIEIAPWGPEGRDLMAIQCLSSKATRNGVGRTLIEAAEEEAREQKRNGIVVIAYYHDFWFMPASFFEKCGFSRVGEISKVTAAGEKEYKRNRALLWKVSDDSAEPPRFAELNYTFRPIPGKVVVDLFTSRSCLTADTEAQRVREVAEEFGSSVVMREYCADDPRIRDEYGISRGVFIDGKEIGWGYEAPKDGVRMEIRKAKGQTTPDG